MLFLGVFDYDEDIGLKIDYHDPIGRAVINTINFESGVTYLLNYDLVDSSQIDKVCRAGGECPHVEFALDRLVPYRFP